MKVLGLDLGKTWGWCVIEYDPEEGVRSAETGEETVPDSVDRLGSRGAIYLFFKRWLEGKVAEVAPDFVAFEAIRHNRGFSYIPGQTAHLTAHLEEREVPYAGFGLTTLKKRGTGHGRAKKGQMIEAAKEAWPGGWDNRSNLTDNQADAFWAAVHGAETMAPPSS